jgi:hypothetical protein
MRKALLTAGPLTLFFSFTLPPVLLCAVYFITSVAINVRYFACPAKIEIGMSTIYFSFPLFLTSQDFL